MKRIVSDLFVRAHGENHVARRLYRRDVDVAMRESPGLPFFQIGLDRSQVGDEFLSDRVGDRRSITVEPFKSGTQRAFARRRDLVTDRVVVTQVERAQERPKGQALEHEGAEHDLIVLTAFSVVLGTRCSRA